MHTTRLSFVMIVALCAGLLPAQSAAADSPAIFQAVAKNNLEQVRAEISRGADVNALDNEDTLLCFAIREPARAPIVKLLLAHPRIDVNKRGNYVDKRGNEWNRTPLILAAHMGQTELVKLLLAKGADIDARDFTDSSSITVGSSALMRATGRDHIDTVRVLLANPRKPNLLIQDANKFIALSFAVERENLEMVKTLHLAGSPLNGGYAWGAPLLTLCKAHKAHAVLEYLVASGADVNGGAGTPLVDAVTGKPRNEPAVLRYIEKLIALKAQVNYKTGGESALHAAARTGFLAAVKLLLDKGAAIDAVNPQDGWSPLGTTVITRNLEVVRYLAKRGAKLEIRGTTGETALSTAVMQADLPMVKFLVEAGAVIDSANPVNVMHTPLHLAVMFLDPLKFGTSMDIARFLLDRKANPDFKSKNGWTPLIACAQIGDQAKGLEKATLLVGYGAKLDLPNAGGETALMVAATRGNERLVRFLVGKGADIHKKSGAGTTAFGYAKLSGQSAIAAFLESKGAKPDTGAGGPKVSVAELIGVWEGYQDGMTQAIQKLALYKNMTFDFQSRLSPEILKQLPPGSMNPIIAAHKGTYTVNGGMLVLQIPGKAPLARAWQLAGGVLVLDGILRLKKIG